MQNTFSQSGNDSKWFLTKIIFQNSLMANETPSRPPPFMANALLNFHFDYWHTSLTNIGFVMENIYSFTIIEFQTYKLRCKLKFNVTCKVKVFSV